MSSNPIGIQVDHIRGSLREHHRIMEAEAKCANELTKEANDLKRREVRALEELAAQRREDRRQNP